MVASFKHSCSFTWLRTEIFISFKRSSVVNSNVLEVKGFRIDLSRMCHFGM